MATGTKACLDNKHLCIGDYFAIIFSCSHSILLTNYATNGPGGALWNEIIENERTAVVCSRCR